MSGLGYYVCIPAKSVLNLLIATKWIALWSVAMTGLAVAGWSQTTLAPNTNASAPVGVYKIEETLIGPWYTEDGSLPQENMDYSLSDDGHHIAYIMPGKNKCDGKSTRCVLFDGQVEALIGSLPVFNLRLSPDGKRVDYIVQNHKHWAVSVNGHIGAEFDNVLLGSFSFSPDGNNLIFTMLQGGQWSTVVLDGHSGVRIDTNRGNLTSGTTSKHVVHIDQVGKRFSVVVDGKASAECDDYFGPVFSPDSKRVAYGIRQKGLWSVVLEGNTGAEYGAISSLVFSPDSKRVAYAAGTRKSWMIIVDGQVYAEDAGRPLEMVSIGDPTVKGHGLNSSVVSGQHVFSHDMAWSPEVSFSPDSKRVAYTAETGEGMKRSRVVVDGNASQGFHRVISPTFSPDGKHIAYVAITTLFKSLTPKWSMVVDDQVSPEYNSILSSPAFSPDGSLEFLAVKGAGMVKAGSLYRVKYIPMQ